MPYPITKDQKTIGYLDCQPDSFSLVNFEDMEQKTILEGFIRTYYEKGALCKPVEGGESKVLKPSDLRFVLELSIRLQALGYELA